MPDPTKRTQNWDAKFDTTRIKATLDAKRPKMLEHVEAVFSSIALMETQVKQTIDASGVPTIQYPFYLCFGREMWSKLRKEMSGESLAQEAAVLIAKWVARGLSQPVLQAIRSEVFNVPAPIAP
jgi:phage gpG-like protein